MRALALLCLAAALTVGARAEGLGDELGTGTLESALPEAARDYMDGVTVETAADSGVLERVADAALGRLGEAVKSSCAVAGVMLAVVVICSVTEAADSTGRASDTVRLAGVAAIGAAAVSDVNSYMSSALEALQTLSDYSRTLLPVLSAAGAASGAVGSAAAKAAATALFMDVLLNAAGALVIPAVCGYAALSIANAAVGNGALQTAARLMKSVCTALLSGLTLGFTLWISVVSVVSGSADAAATRLAKTVISAALPVVGRIASDAAGTLAAAAASVRGLAGTFGLLAVLCVCLTPFVRLGARYLVYKLAAAVCSCLAGGRLSGLLDAIGACFGMLLALVGTGALFLFISLFSLMRTVT